MLGLLVLDPVAASAIATGRRQCRHPLESDTIVYSLASGQLACMANGHLEGLLAKKALFQPRPPGSGLQGSDIAKAF